MNHCWKSIGVIALGAAMAAPAAAQVSLGGNLGRWYFGGGVGVGFGNISYVNISPFAGYRITDEWSVGAGLQYRYRNDDRFGRDLSTTDYGSNVFTRYRIAGPLFVHGEYEYLNFEYYRGASKERTGVSSVLAGGGISQPLGRNASFFAMVLYNLSYSSYASPAPYASPWVVRAGVGFNF